MVENQIGRIWSVRTRTLAAAGLLLIAMNLPATATAHEDEAVELTTVVVEGRQQDLIGEAVSAAQGIVGQAELERRPMQRTGDVLEVIPGLVVTQHSGTGKSNQMFLRGFNLDHGTDFATFVDGVPVNMPSHGHGQGYTDINFIIPELIRSVDYRKGPYYVEVGDFSGAGSARMNLVDRLDSGFVKGGTGEYGFNRLLAVNSYAIGDGSLLVGLETHAYDGPWEDVPEDLSRITGMARYSRRDTAGNGWSLTFMGYDADWDSADQIPERAVRNGLISELGSLDTTVGGMTSRYSLSGNSQWGDDGFRARASAYVVDYDLDLYSNFTYFLDDPVNGDQFGQVDDRIIAGGAFEYTWLPTGAGEHMHHTLGVQVRRDDIGEVGLYRTVARQRLSTVRQDSVKEFNIGLYYGNKAEWTPQLRTNVGVRLDYFDFEVEGPVPANRGSASDLLISPKANVTYQVRDDLEIYGSAGTGFHSNDARGATISIDPVSGEPVSPVDPLVRSTGAELGLRSFFSEKLNLSASLWYLELDSELLFVGDAGNTEVSGESRRYGIEFASYYRLDDVWTFDLDVSLANAEFAGVPSGEKEIPGTLDRVISAGASAVFPGGAFGSLRLRHFGERPLIEDGSARAGSGTVFNLQAGYEWEQLRFELNVLNLLDSDDRDIDYFYASRLPGEPEGGVDDIHYHPLEPRSIRASLQWRFGGGT